MINDDKSEYKRSISKTGKVECIPAHSKNLSKLQISVCALACSALFTVQRIMLQHMGQWLNLRYS